MADEFLTQELPAIRRAQARSLVALRSLIWLVDRGLWKDWREGFVISPQGKVSELGPRVGPPVKRPSPSSSPPELPLALFAVCLDAIDSIAEARGILPLPEAQKIQKDAEKLRKRMIRDVETVSSGVKRTQSRAFGRDDPLTASWLLPILHKKPVSVKEHEKLLRLGSVSLFDNVREGIRRLLSPEDYMVRGGRGARENTAEEHAWPASLAVRALNLVTRGDPKQALDPPPDADAAKRRHDAREQAPPSVHETLRLWSEHQVRLQLARAVTGEAGQDAAHLAAALSVAMWLEELPLPLLEAAAEQLCTMQRPDGSLVLTRPYLADREGSVLTPLAADVTMAIVAVADQLDVRYPEHPTALRIEQRLLEAVQQQREAYFRLSLRKGGTGPSGEAAMAWSSDRARPSSDTCDTWTTARTVTALVMILNLESRLLTRRLLEESRFSYRPGGQIEKGFDDLVDPELVEPAKGQSNGRVRSRKPRISVAQNAKSPRTIRIRGAGFVAEESGTIKFDEASYKFKADGSGSFDKRCAVPPTTPAGDTTVTATGSARVASVEFRRTVVSTLRAGLTEPDPDPDGKKIRAVLLCGPPGTSKTSLIEAVAKQLTDDLVEKQLGRYLVYLVQLSPADFLLDGPDKVEHRAKRIFDYLTQMENVVVLFDEIDRLILDRDSPEYEKQGDVFQFMTPSMLPKLTALRHRGSAVRFAIATNYSERIDAAIARKGRIDRSFVISPPNLNARTDILEKKRLDSNVAKALAAVTPLWVYSDLTPLGKDANPERVMLRRPSVSLASYKSRRFTPRKEILAEEILQLARLYLEGAGPKVLAKRPPDETNAIAWARKRASGDRQEEATEMIERLKKEKVGPFVPWDDEEEAKHPPAGSQKTATASA
ncbi:MAG TPA: ATP-binding protein [Gaiellaceae bacterium]